MTRPLRRPRARESCFRILTRTLFSPRRGQGHDCLHPLPCKGTIGLLIAGATRTLTSSGHRSLWSVRSALVLRGIGCSERATECDSTGERARDTISSRAATHAARRDRPSAAVHERARSVQREAGHGLLRTRIVQIGRPLQKAPKCCSAFPTARVPRRSQPRRRCVDARRQRRRARTRLASGGQRWLEALEAPRQGARLTRFVLAIRARARRVSGGNLTLLHACAAAGRLFTPTTRCWALETGEQRNRVDRMLAAGALSGEFAKVAAVRSWATSSIAGLPCRGQRLGRAPRTPERARVPVSRACPSDTASSQRAAAAPGAYRLRSGRARRVTVTLCATRSPLTPTHRERVRVIGARLLRAALFVDLELVVGHLLTRSGYRRQLHRSRRRPMERSSSHAGWPVS